MILGYAKLRLLSFYYDFLDVFVDRSDYQMAEIDTDSMYFATSGPSLESVIKPAMKSTYESHVYKRCDDQVREVDLNYWLPRQCCEKHKHFDRRVPGLWKLEASGNSMMCLNSKTYLLDQGTSYKMSSKGISKSRVENAKETFRSVLDTKLTQGGTNTGFVCRNNTMYTYKQNRAGFTYFYCKRKVLPDGSNTIPLDITLCPWNVRDVVAFADNHLLSISSVHPITYGGQDFDSVYRAWMYTYAMFHDDDNCARAVLNAKSIKDACAIVAFIRPSDAWLQSRVVVMKELLELKVAKFPEVRASLLQSGLKPLIYADNSEFFWSSGIRISMASLIDPKEFPGRNELGRLWELIRREL
jgi:predicted NAD-dependent protein-ADP-ribosyltransferase YbiA (DUF1768 family)